MTVWDIQSGKSVLTFTDHEARVFALCFSPDGRRLYSGTADATIGVRDLTWFDRHIAGNLEYQLGQIAAQGGEPVDAAPLRRWARRVLERP